MKRKVFRKNQEKRLHMFNIQKGICPYCLQKMHLELRHRSSTNLLNKNRASWDHVYPYSKNRNHTYNLVLACTSCNHEKNDNSDLSVEAYLRTREIILTDIANKIAHSLECNGKLPWRL